MSPAPTTRLALGLARRTYGLSLAAVPERLDLPRVLNARGLTGRGAEVGVYLGEFTEHLLDGWSGRELIAVDPWRAFGSDEYRDVLNAEQAAWDERHDQTVARLRRFGDRAVVWRTTGDEAAARITDGSLDWVYLDAMHDHDSVAHDLRTWWPKLRPGAIFAGHDYLEGRRGITEFGVRPAVDAFFATQGVDVSSTYLDEPFISWLVEVPGAPRSRSLVGRPVARAVRSALLTARRITRHAGKGR